MITLPINENELADAVRATIEALPRPAFVDRIEYEFRNDHTGDFGVWPYVIITDDTELAQFRGKKLERTPAGVEARAFQTHITDSVFPRYRVFPHVRFRTISEQAEGDTE